MDDEEVILFDKAGESLYVRLGTKDVYFYKSDLQPQIWDKVVSLNSELIALFEALQSI
jgi:hypothetical protein